MGWATSATQLRVLIPLAAVSVYIIRRLVRDRIERKGYPLPPGPTPLPLLGNALSVDAQEPFRTYTEWRAKYGDVIYVRLLDMDVVVLNSTSVASDLLEKRSKIYSDRPLLATAVPYGHDTNFALSPYGEQWRFYRRIFHQTFRANAIGSFYPAQLRKAREMILNVMNSPNDYAQHYSTYSASVMMGSVYDYDPSPRNDRIVSTMNEFVDASLPALLPERAVMFKAFPFVLNIPDGLPGSWIKHEARMARELRTRIIEVPYQHVKKRMGAHEDVNPSMVSDHIVRMDKLDEARRSEYEEALKIVSSTAVLAALESTNSVLTVFTLAMVDNPRIWKRAQANIDAVVGRGRLPEFSDRSSLPYVDAILRESLRWQPPVPLNVPHATTSSDIYNGYYIPKGATVFANTWAMSRDETRYPNPEEFIPERFLDTHGMLTDDVPDFIFGFGRRICPGRYTGMAALWSAMVTMLSTLDFNHAKDADGRDIAIKAQFLNSITRHPLAFPCHLSPRPHVSKALLGLALP